MKTKVAAIYGKRDVRLREFELPEITDNELLVSVISDSVCLSTRKAALLGSEHKRVPDDLENHPVITGHECAGVIVEVGKNLTGKYKKASVLYCNRRWGYQADIQQATATNILAVTPPI